jgi:hypothetical protein
VVKLNSGFLILEINGSNIQGSNIQDVLGQSFAQCSFSDDCTVGANQI